MSILLVLLFGAVAGFALLGLYYLTTVLQKQSRRVKLIVALSLVLGVVAVAGFALVYAQLHPHCPDPFGPECPWYLQ